MLGHPWTWNKIRNRILHGKHDSCIICLWIHCLVDQRPCAPSAAGSVGETSPDLIQRIDGFLEVIQAFKGLFVKLIQRIVQMVDICIDLTKKLTVSVGYFLMHFIQDIDGSLEPSLRDIVVDPVDSLPRLVGCGCNALRRNAIHRVCKRRVFKNTHALIGVDGIGGSNNPILVAMSHPLSDQADISACFLEIINDKPILCKILSHMLTKQVDGLLSEEHTLIATI